MYLFVYIPLYVYACMHTYLHIQSIDRVHTLHHSTQIRCRIKQRSWLGYIPSPELHSDSDALQGAALRSLCQNWSRTTEEPNILATTSSCGVLGSGNLTCSYLQSQCLGFGLFRVPSLILRSAETYVASAWTWSIVQASKRQAWLKSVKF